MPIKIYTVGGTIDKVYFDQKSEYQVGEPEIAEILKEANIAFECSPEEMEGTGNSLILGFVRGRR